MTGSVNSYTPNFKFKLINFNIAPWHDLEWSNWKTLDTLFANFVNVNNIKGIWTNATAVVAGERYIDDAVGQIFECLIAHTTPATGTFADSRVANPTYWKTLALNERYRGPWATGTLYGAGDFVTNGLQYAVCKQQHTSTVFASDAATYWEVLIDLTADIAAIEADVTASAASAATASSAAAEASQAALAAQAAANDVAWVWKGVWSAATTYGVRDLVERLGSSYLCMQAHTNQEPPNATYWALVAAKGADGTGGDMLKSQNLSGLTNTATARTNLGLGTAATKNTGTSAGQIPLYENFGDAAFKATGTADAQIPTNANIKAPNYAINWAKAPDVVSAATTDIANVTGNFVVVTGNATITALGTVAAGAIRFVRFTGTPTLTHNATTLILIAGKNISVEAGDIAEFVSLGSGNWALACYQRASGKSLIAPIGGISGLATKSADYTMTAGDAGTFFIFNGTPSGDYQNLLLPNIATYLPGTVFGVSNDMAAGKSIYIDPYGSQTIGGQAYVTIASGESATFISDGIKWHRRESSSASGSGSSGPTFTNLSIIYPVDATDAVFTGSSTNCTITLPASFVSTLAVGEVVYISGLRRYAECNNFVGYSYVRQDGLFTITAKSTTTTITVNAATQSLSANAQSVATQYWSADYSGYFYTKISVSKTTHTIAAGVSSIRATVIGGGAGGELGGKLYATYFNRGGRGGGGGGYARGIFDVIGGITLEVRVGHGGYGGVHLANTNFGDYFHPATNGGTSSAGSLISATGGQAVIFSDTAPNSAQSGGAGGTGVGGQINNNGGRGGNYTAGIGSTSTSYYQPATGGGAAGSLNGIGGNGADLGYATGIVDGGVGGNGPLSAGDGGAGGDYDNAIVTLRNGQDGQNGTLPHGGGGGGGGGSHTSDSTTSAAYARVNHDGGDGGFPGGGGGGGGGRTSSNTTYHGGFGGFGGHGCVILEW